MIGHSQYQVWRLKKIVTSIRKQEQVYASLSDQALQEQGRLFQKILRESKQDLMRLLPNVFALAVIAIQRVMGIRLYDEQLMGAIVLAEGNIAEMKTGEGKTLTAFLPLYLSALTGRKTLLVTTNAYLAKRDADELTPVFQFLNLSVGLAVWDDKKPPSPDYKRQVYQADVIYTTSSGLGFDYLTEHLADSLDKTFFPCLDYVIIDEIDAVLLDMVQTPLVISGSPRLQSPLYRLANQFVSLLDKEHYHCCLPDKEIWLTDAGITYAEQFFRIKNLYAPQHFELVRHLLLALKAHHFYLLGRDYLVLEEEIKLIDQQNGRLLMGTKLQGGLHQAIECKEGVALSAELKTVASITYQNLFLSCQQLAGMTGTAQSARIEFNTVYGMEVVAIPLHRPLQRVDLPDLYYPDLITKTAAVVELVKSCHAKGQPVLLVTGTVEFSHYYSQLLLKEKIAHTLLNAKSVGKESEIIARAGQYGAVTITSQMAGRGTDIKLGKGVKEVGGLALIMSQRFATDRLDQQIRGRAGRQGDPGFSQAFISLDDDLLLEYGHQGQLARLRKRSNLSSKKTRVLIQRLVTQAQALSAHLGQEARSRTLSFDNSLNFQRRLVYRERQQILAGHFQFDLITMIDEVMTTVLEERIRSKNQLVRYILDHISYDWQGLPDRILMTDKEGIKDYLISLIEQKLDDKQAFLGQDFTGFLHLVALKALDELWQEQVDYLQQLRLVMSGLPPGPSNPLFDYHQEAKNSYERMREAIKERLLTYLCLSEVSYTATGRLSIYFG